MDRHFPTPQIFDHSGPKFRHNGNVSPLKNDVFYHQKCLFRSAVWLSVSPSHLSTIWTKTARKISLPPRHSGSHISLSKWALENWNILALTRTPKLNPVVHCFRPLKELQIRHWNIFWSYSHVSFWGRRSESTRAKSSIIIKLTFSVASMISWLPTDSEQIFFFPLPKGKLN